MDQEQRIGFTIVTLILCIDMLVYSILVPVIPYLQHKFNPSSTVMGVLLSIYAFALLIFTPFFGTLSDKIGRKVPILLGLFFFAFSTFLFAIGKNMPMLILARFIQGVAASSIWSAAFALLADIFPSKVRGVAIGLVLTLIEIGSLFGAPLSGWFLEIGGYKLPFFFTMWLSIICFLFGLILLRDPLIIKNSKVTFLDFLKKNNVIFMSIIVFIANSTLYLLEPVLPLFLTDKFKISPIMIGILFGVTTLAYAIVTPFLGFLTEKISVFKLITLGMIFLSFSIPFIVMVKNIWQEFFAMFALGISVSISSSPALYSLSKVADTDGVNSYGAAYGVFNMFHAIGMIVGPLLGGFLMDFIPFSSVIMGLSVFLFLISMLTLFYKFVLTM